MARKGNGKSSETTPQIVHKFTLTLYRGSSHHPAEFLYKWISPCKKKSLHFEPPNWMGGLKCIFAILKMCYKNVWSTSQHDPWWWSMRGKSTSTLYKSLQQWSVYIRLDVLLVVGVGDDMAVVIFAVIWWPGRGIVVAGMGASICGCIAVVGSSVHSPIEVVMHFLTQQILAPIWRSTTVRSGTIIKWGPNLRFLLHLLHLLECAQRINEPRDYHFLQLRIDHHVVHPAKLQQLLAHFLLTLGAAHGHEKLQHRRTLPRLTSVVRHHSVLFRVTWGVSRVIH